MSAFVGASDTVLVKPNVAWDRVLRACMEAGARKVIPIRLASVHPNPIDRLHSSDWMDP